MTKNEKLKLAKIIISMKHGTGATYETLGYADELMNTFPKVESEVWELEESAYISNVVDIINAYLHGTINPPLINRGRYRPAHELWSSSGLILPSLIEEYLVEKEELAEDLFEKLDRHHDTYNRAQALHKLFSDPVWVQVLEEYVDDSIKVRYLKGELEEFSFIEEMRSSGVIE